MEVSFGPASRRPCESWNATAANDYSMNHTGEAITTVLTDVTPLFGNNETTRNKQQKPSLRKQRMEWSPLEDAILCRLIGKKKINPNERIWIGLAAEFNERSPMSAVRSAKDCRERWQHVLNPKLKKGPLSKEEIKAVEQMYSSFGPKWTAMAKILKGRSERDIKNNWNSRQRTKSKKPGNHHVTDTSWIPNPNGPAPVFPPNFSLDILEKPTAQQMTLSVQETEMDVADTLLHGLARHDNIPDVDDPSTQSHSASWQTADSETNSFHEIFSDDFKGFDPLCIKWV